MTVARRRTRTLHKADVRKTAAAAGAVTYTPETVAAIAAALAGKQPANAAVTPLPRQPGLGAVPFGPGVPLTPAAINAPRPDSGRPEPRAYEYAVTSNLPGNNEKLIPWTVLRQAADGVSIFRKCITIRKNEFTGLEWDIRVSKKAVMRELRTAGATSRVELEQQMRDRLAPQIARLHAFWEEPDRRNGEDWIGWIKKALEERFVLDALAIYPRHTFAGDLYSLEILDGSTIKPLLDADGGRPMPPAAAYQQILWGFPRGEFLADLGEDGLPDGTYAADQLVYEVDERRSWTRYGNSAVERALSDGALYVQRNAWQMAEWTDGVMPSGWLLAGEGQANWSPDQLAEYERVLNDYYAGITAARQRLRILPYGMQPHESASVAEKYKPDYDLYLLKLCAGHFETTITELGFTETGGLGSTGYHDGQADVLERKATKPTVAAVQALINKLSRRHLGMPMELEFVIGDEEADDENAADEIADRQVKGGRTTINEDRDRRGLARFSFPEADKPFVMGGTGGITFLEGAEQAAQDARDQAAAIAQAKTNPPAPGDDGGGPSSSGGGPDDQPDDSGPSSGGLNKLEDADLVKAEVAAYTRWARKNPNARRPFAVQYAQPTDFQDADPNTLEFVEWVWEPADLSKADWSEALHPRDHRGRFRKRTLSELTSFLEGKHGKDRSKYPAKARRALEEAEAAEPKAPKRPDRRTAAGRQAERDDMEAQRKRGQSLQAVSDAAAELEEVANNGADMDVIRRRAHQLADKHARTAAGDDLRRLAQQVETADDPEEVVLIARELAEHHGLTRIGEAGGHVKFTRKLHQTIPGERLEEGQAAEVIRPGHTAQFDTPIAQHVHGEGTHDIPVHKAVVTEPYDVDNPAPLVPAGRKRTPAQPRMHPHLGRPETDDERILRESQESIAETGRRLEQHGRRRVAERERAKTDPAFAEELRQRDIRTATALMGISGGLTEGEEGDRDLIDVTPLQEHLAAGAAAVEPSAPSGGVVEGEVVDTAGRMTEIEPTAPRATAARHSHEDTAQTLSAFTSRDQARSHLDAMKLSTPQMRQLAHDMGVQVPGGASRSAVREAIIDTHVGAGHPAIESGHHEPSDVVEGVIEGELPTRETSIPIGRDGKARLRDAGKERATGTPPAPAKSKGLLRPSDFSADPDAVRDALRTAKSREEGHDVFDKLNLRADELRTLARELDVPHPAKANKQQIRDAIVQHHVGSRLTHDAILNAPSARHSGGVYAEPTRDEVRAAAREVEAVTPPVAAAASVEAGRYSSKPRTPNQWGGGAAATASDVSYHPDGAIGRSIPGLGQDAALDVDGKRLDSVLDRIASETVAGRMTGDEQVSALRRLADRLPTRAAGHVRGIADEIDAPKRPRPASAEGAPKPLRDLMDELLKYPLARGGSDADRTGNPSYVDKLDALLRDWHDGKMSPMRLAGRLQTEVYNQRHESMEGKVPIDRAIGNTVRELEQMVRTDRNALLPPQLRKADAPDARSALAKNDSANRAVANAERLRGSAETPALGVAGADGLRLGERKLAGGGHDEASLRDRVGDVVSVRSDEQVRGVDAGRVVASMADDQTRRDVTEGQLIGKAMGANGDASTAVGTSTGNPEDAVAAAVGVASAGPEPALAGPVNLGPEAIHSGIGHNSILPKAEAGGDPKAPAPDQRWPAWEVDEAIAAAYAPQILTALAGGLVTLAAARALAERWLKAARRNPGLGPATWLEEQGFDVTGPLTGVLSDVYTEAAMVGERSATAAISTPARLAVSLETDWGAWTPGDVDAARLILSADGRENLLQDLLDRFGITIRTIAHNRLDDLARILADGLERGSSPDEIAREIRTLTGDTAKAYRIAVTETARAISAAAVAQYEIDGIATKAWMTADDDRVCEICKANEDAGDIPLDALFPSMVPFPPAHPHDRCAVIPGMEAL